jgi:hypothetical protein
MSGIRSESSDDDITQPDTTPMQRLLAPDNSDVLGAIRKFQILANGSKLWRRAYI